MYIILQITKNNLMYHNLKIFINFGHCKCNKETHELEVSEVLNVKWVEVWMHECFELSMYERKFVSNSESLVKSVSMY